MPCVILWVVVVVIVGASVGRVSGQHVVHCELNHEDGLYYVRPLLKEWLRTLVIDDEEYYVCHNIDSTEPVYSIYEVWTAVCTGMPCSLMHWCRWQQKKDTSIGCLMVKRCTSPSTTTS